MIVEGDVSGFLATVADIRARLVKLNADGTLGGLSVLFERLMDELPPDLFECEPVVTVITEGINPIPSVVIRPGNRLNALATALRAFDLDADNFHVGLPSTEDIRS